MTSVHNKRELSEKRLYLRKNQTNAERIIWNYLKAKRLDNLKFKRQHSIDWYIADFYCADKRLVIEIDGGSHFTKHAVEYDNNRTKLFNFYKIAVIRFTNEEIYNDIENVLNKIRNYVSTSPSLSLQRRGG
jgi:very-short-patch-repair endonuclease